MRDARRALEEAAHRDRARLLAYLAVRTHDIAAAEDALAAAFVAALDHWPRIGVPARPDVWLLVAARRNLIDGARRAQTHSDAVPALRHAAAIGALQREDAGLDLDFGDDRLKLLFVCAHPAIDAAARAPLMLQTVLGLDAARIASAFLVAPATMGQRLVRAKQRIRDAGIPFAVPSGAQLGELLEAVLDAIYAAYGSGWDAADGSDARRRGLAEEVLLLARLTAELLPDEPEALGLLALLLYCESRRDARRVDGAYVPLAQQDTRRWSRMMILEAERVLGAAMTMGRIGRYQLEAAIQSAHARRVTGTVVPWTEVVALYDGLATLAPSIGALVSRAAALSSAGEAQRAVEALDALPADRIRDYQPWWAVRAEALRQLARNGEAAEAYRRAIGLAEDPTLRAFLQTRSDAVRE